MCYILGISKNKKYRIVEDSNLHLTRNKTKKYITLSDALKMKLKVNWIYYNQYQLHKIVWSICENRLASYNPVGMDTTLPKHKRRSYYYTFYHICMRSISSSDFDEVFAHFKLSNKNNLQDAKPFLDILSTSNDLKFISFMLYYLNFKM